jgi:hypothetical protein
MRGLIERAYWGLAKRVYRAKRVGGIEFVYIDADGHRPAAELQRTLVEALDLISAARGGFGELVTSHLRLVAAVQVPNVYALHTVRAYVSPFRGHEATNSQYLACQLVWAATFIRLSRDVLARGEALNKPAIRQASYEAQKRFLEQLPNSEEWIDYLERNKPSFEH